MNTEQKNFIDTLKPIIAKYAGNNYCIECILAQAILESGWGKSSLASVHHNYFGMKTGRGWKGEKVELDTKEEINGKLVTVKGSFRAYADIESGIAGYFEFIKYPRYENLKSSKDYKEYANNLKADGWATSSAYANSLINIVETYLIEAPAPAYAPEPVPVDDNDAIKVIAKYVIKGHYGNGHNNRSNAIYSDVRFIVNCIYAKIAIDTSSELNRALYSVALDVIRGDYGNGSLNRRSAIYEEVRACVNDLMKG